MQESTSNITPPKIVYIYIYTYIFYIYIYYNKHNLQLPLTSMSIKNVVIAKTTSILQPGKYVKYPILSTKWPADHQLCHRLIADHRDA